MEGNITLTYFDGEGRAELSRLLLRVGGIKFTDKRVSFPEFGKMKGDKNSIIWKGGFGSMPILEHNGFFLAQSQAIH
jgi:glutathione S-transferase